MDETQEQQQETESTEVMLATEQGEQQAEQQLTTPQIVTDLMAQMRWKVNTAEAKLQSEESGTVIANLQGYCAGHRTFMKCIRETGWADFRYNDEAIEPYENDGSCILEYDAIVPVHNALDDLTKSDAWKNLHTFMEQEVTEKKNELFYKSDKGRDLHFCKGWYSAMTQIDDWIDELNNDYEIMQAQEEKRQAEKKEELPFEEN